METRWLTDREQRSWRRLAAVLEVLPATLDAQLVRDQSLTHFDYFTLAMLSEAPDRTLRMSALAACTNASLARLSNVVRRLEGRGLLQRRPSADDRRATDVELSEAGWDAVVQAAPGHVDAVRAAVFDALSPEQVDQLGVICGLVLDRLDPDRTMMSVAR